MNIKDFCLCITIIGVSFAPVVHAAEEVIEPTPQKGSAYDTLKFVEDPDKYKQNENRYKPKYLAEQSVKDQILERFSFGREVRNIWDIADGEKDLYYAGLRADIGNLGLAYTIDDMDYFKDMELKFSAGKDNEVSLTTHTMPFIGKVDGFTLRGTAGDDGSKVFARYTIDLY